jgi:hypothetical protein
MRRGRRGGGDTRSVTPGPAQVQSVTLALDDPMQVDYGAPT